MSSVGRNYRVIWGFEVNEKIRKWVDEKIEEKVRKYEITGYFEVFITDKPSSYLGLVMSREKEGKEVPVVVLNFAGLVENPSKEFSAYDKLLLFRGEFPQSKKREVNVKKFEKFKKKYERVIDEEMHHVKTFYSSNEIGEAYRTLREAAMNGGSLPYDQIKYLAEIFAKVENAYWEEKGEIIPREEMERKIRKYLTQFSIISP